MIGLCVGSVQRAQATAQLRLNDGIAADTVVVTDNGPGDSDPSPGIITYSGSIGTTWALSVTVGQGYPALGSPALPYLDLGTANRSSGAGNLTIEFTQDGYTAPGVADLQIGGTTVGSVQYSVFTDPNNTLFGETTLIGTMTPTPVNGAFSGEVNGTVTGPAPYSITLQTILTHSVAGNSGFDAQLTITPPACHCTLRFISPQSFTNCAGDVIPDAVAVQDCGGGLSNTVPVAVTGAVTNGSCPSIIIRTNTAMDACGNIQTFVQNITVNCPGGICGHVFADCDGSGDLSSGDVGISNVIVSLLDASNHFLGKITSDANGGYCFTNLPGGSYVVTINPPSGYCETAASTSYHWKDSYGRICWQENDGYIHCLSSGIECWWDKSNTCHWKDSYNRDCWKDGWGVIHCQQLSYKSCNAQTNNNCISVTLTNCASQTDVDFAYTGTKPSLSVSCSGPSYVKCGQSYTYTCTVVNTGNVCYKGGTVCTTVGNCNYWGGWNYGCSNYTGSCPPLSPGQKCTFTVKCSFNSWNCGTVACQSRVNCNYNSGSSSSQSTCYSQCGW